MKCADDRDIQVGVRHVKTTSIQDGHFCSIRLHDRCKRICDEFEADSWHGDIEDGYYFSSVHDWAHEIAGITI